MNGCTVTFEGDHGGTYTVSSDMVGYINDDLVNDGYNGTIYLYPADRVQATRTEYIALPNCQTPRYYSGSTTGYSLIIDRSNVEFNLQSQVMRATPIIQLGFMFLCSLFVIVKIFSRS